MSRGPQLQVAQIIADLQSLHTAPSTAALALLTLGLDPKPHYSCGKPQDKTKPIIQTERHISEKDDSEQINQDIERAKALIYLYEAKEKFSQLSDTGLTNAKQRVDTIAAKYTKIRAENSEKEY